MGRGVRFAATVGGLMELDLLVVGAGPAGTAAAITAADLGLRVRVVDKARFPRDKTCGDGLTTGALRRLERLGLDARELPSYTSVREVVIVGPDGRRIDLPLPDRGEYAAVVPRVELDHALVRLARRRGVTIDEGVAVGTLETRPDSVAVGLDTGETIEARNLVAADGHYSTVRRLARPDAAPQLGTWHAFRQYFRGVDDSKLWVLFEADLLPGYAWVFPLGDGRVNVGYGVLRDAHTTGKQLKALWADVLARPSMRAVLGPDARPEGTVRAWPIPAELHRDQLVAGRVLFVGDAASVVDPLTGEGIAQALETGALAAEAVADDGDVGARYARSVSRALGADLAMARGLQRVMGGRRATQLSMSILGLTPWTRRNFARWMFEDYPRALLFTPRRWARGAFTAPGAYLGAQTPHGDPVSSS
jgi:geranylgeranyl reductase family protein